MKARSIRIRRGSDLAIRCLASLAALVGIAFLGWILSVVLARGIGAINWDSSPSCPPRPASRRAAWQRHRRHADDHRHGDG